MPRAVLLDHFSGLTDPRQAWKVIYPLPEILLIVLCGTMAGAEDFADIERWAKQKLSFLRRFCPFERGIPSHDTLNDVMNALPARLFAECFSAWVCALREDTPDIVAIDGKTSRRAHGADGSALHLVSAWAARQRLVLGQEAVDKKSNEIVAIPLLLERLELQGALVTIDAMGCQKSIAEEIRAKGADYLLALKDNWPTLADDVRLFFDNEPMREDHSFVTTDGDHGRIEVRRCRVSHDVAWLSTSRRFPGEPRFPALATLGMIEAEVQRDGKTSLTRRYYLSSAPLSAQQLAGAVRAHWGIENRMHWVLDVVFHDDLMRLRTENGPANMAVTKHFILNLIKQIPDKNPIKTRRKMFGWDEDYLQKAVRQSWS